MSPSDDAVSPALPGAALLVVDLQDSVLDLVADRDELLRRSRLAIQAAGLFGIPTYASEQVPEKLGPTTDGIAELIPRDHRFAKTGFSALAAPGLAERLETAGISHLLLAGIETPVCIYQTAIAARDADLDVTVLTDCIGGRRPRDAADALRTLAAAGCTLLPAETVFYAILGGSFHPAFRAFTRLVKAHG